MYVYALQWVSSATDVVPCRGAKGQLAVDIPSSRVLLVGWVKTAPSAIPVRSTAAGTAVGIPRLPVIHRPGHGYHTYEHVCA